MNRHDAAARLELLLARVIARKDAPRTHAFTATAPAAEAPAKPTTPEVMAAVDALDDDANDGSPEVSLHPPLAGDPGIGPEIDLIERTMDLDVFALEATLAATQATSVTIARPFQSAPVPDVSATLDDLSPLDEPLSLEPEALRAPTPLPLRAPTPARPVAAIEPDVVEPEALAPHRPVMRASTPPPLRAPTPAPLRALTPAPIAEMYEPVVEMPAPVVETPAPVVETPAPVAEVPVVEMPAPVVETPAPERFEAKALPVEAAVVAVVAMAPLAPRSLRDILARSMTLKVRRSPRG
jgi:hypothetical protein